MVIGLVFKSARSIRRAFWSLTVIVCVAQVGTTLARADGRDPSLNWDALPCLSSQDYTAFRHLIPALGLSETPVTCGSKTKLDFFLRLLNFTATIRVDRSRLSAKIRDIHPAFRGDNPSQVLFERFGSLNQILFAEADNYRAGINAGYSAQQNSLNIGSSFFSKSPIEAMLTLFHESQHQDSSTPKHVFCSHGRDFGAYCDDVIALDPNMGSYSFEVSFAFGLVTAGTNLSAKAKATLQAHALDRLATSFNRIDPRFAAEQDLLVVGDPQGRLWQLSPWLGQLIPFPSAVQSGPARMIEPGIFRRTDLSILSAAGSFFALLNGTAAQLETIRFQTAGNQSVTSVDQNWRSVELVFHRQKYGRSYLNSRNELFFQTGFSSNTAQLEQIPFSSDVSLKKQFMRGNGASLFLGENGSLYGIKGQALYAPTVLQDPESLGWVDASSGYFRNSILALNQSGKLYFYDHDGNWQLSQYSSGTASGAEVVKFKEGRSSLAQMDRNSKLIWSGFSSGITRTVDSGFAVTDFAIISRVKPHLGMGRAAEVSPRFFESCKIVRYTQDPWTWLGIGITAQGKLVFEMRAHNAADDRSQCLVTENSGIQNIQIDRTQGFPRLKLTKFDGSVEFLQ